MPPKKKGGRYTPKGGSPPRSAAARTGGEAERSPDASRSSRAARPPRKPSPVWFLALVGVLWVAAGLMVAVRVEGSWRIAPAMILAFVGLAYLRAAVRELIRRRESGR